MSNNGTYCPNVCDIVMGVWQQFQRRIPSTTPLSNYPGGSIAPTIAWIIHSDVGLVVVEGYKLQCLLCCPLKAPRKSFFCSVSRFTSSLTSKYTWLQFLLDAVCAGRKATSVSLPVSASLCNFYYQSNYCYVKRCFLLSYLTQLKSN